MKQKHLLMILGVPIILVTSFMFWSLSYNPAGRASGSFQNPFVSQGGTFVIGVGACVQKGIFLSANHAENTVRVKLEGSGEMDAAYSEENGESDGYPVAFIIDGAPYYFRYAESTGKLFLEMVFPDCPLKRRGDLFTVGTSGCEKKMLFQSFDMETQTVYLKDQRSGQLYHAVYDLSTQGEFGYPATVRIQGVQYSLEFNPETKMLRLQDVQRCE
ncbi:MAG: hypothetical protein V1735_00495 [Nanoarchaeota archaeon]